MKLIHVLVLLARGKASSAPASGVRRPRKITVPAARDAATDSSAARLADSRCNASLRPASAEPPTLNPQPRA